MHTFVNRKAHTVQIPAESIAAYDHQALTWFRMKGIAVGEVVAATNTLCGQNTTSITNTANGDGNVDNMTDQVTDDSSD